MAQPFPNQLFHNATEPLDSTARVEALADLNDRTKVVPYVGKLVHVVETHTIYVCAEAPLAGQAKWRPLFAEDGTAFYLTNVTASGVDEVFKITAIRDGVNKGRIQVTYPG